MPATGTGADSGLVRDALARAQAKINAIRGLPAGGSDGQYLGRSGGLPAWVAPPAGGGDGTNPAVAYAPATATSNDTSALLAAMTAARDAGKAFMAPPGVKYVIDPITVPQGLRIEGALAVKGRVPGQSHVMRLSGAAHDLTGTSLIVDANSAVDGLQLFNAGRSRFGYVDARNAVRNGVHLMQTDGAVTTPNNNNQTSWGHIVVAGNGSKITGTATVASQTGTWNAINSGYTTFTLSTALPAWAVDVRVVDSGDETVLSAYLVIIGGQAYRVKSVKSTTSIEVYNYPTASAGSTVTMDVLLGAGFNCPMFRDNQAGLINNLDAISNKSIGLNAGSAYGWSYSKSAYQGNGVGVNVQNFTQGANWIGPYFELNTVDMVIGTNADATITSPQWSDFRLQALWDRLSSRGQTHHPGLKVIGSVSGAGGRVGPLTANEPPTANPGTLSISPGYSYAFQRSAGNPALRIAPAKVAPLYGAYMIDVVIECTGAWSGVVNFSMLTGGDYFADTVMGASTYATPTLSAGTHFFRLFRIGTDWRVTRISSGA